MAGIGRGGVVNVWGFRPRPAGLGSASEVRRVIGSRTTRGSLWFGFGGE